MGKKPDSTERKTARTGQAESSREPAGSPPAEYGRQQASSPEGSFSHLSSLLDSVKPGIISLDGQGGIRVFNAAAENLFSVPRSQVVGKPFSELGRAMGDNEDNACRALAERLSHAIWAAGAAVELEYDLIQNNGTRRVISYSVHPLGLPAWSIENGVVIVLEDITRKKQMEDQISDARKHLLAVFDGITDGILVVDAGLRVTAVNKSMRRLIGQDIKTGALCYEACGPRGEKCDDCPAEETFQTGIPASITRKLEPRGSNGQARYLDISTFPMVDRGNRVIKVVEYIKDVTEKVRLAERLEQSRRLAELGEIAARVAHEVRNPLNAITGAAHFLSSEYSGDDTLQKFTNLIKRQSVRVNQVASDLLYVSKPMRTRFAAINVNAVLDQSLDLVCEQLRDQGITVSQNLSSGLPGVMADELQLEQVFHNLIRNAIEAMPGGGSLRVSTNLHRSGEGVEIRVQDNGPGIAEHDRDRVFQPYFTTKMKGTGLGLAIVQRVLKNHNASILMEQPLTGGTLVIVHLPVNADRLSTGDDNACCTDSTLPEISS